MKFLFKYKIMKKRKEFKVNSDFGLVIDWMSQSGDISINAYYEIENKVRQLAPLYYATNFDVRLTRDMAIHLLLEGDESVMCKEYGDDEDWVGLTMDDLDENNLLDEDWVTFEYWSIHDDYTQKILDEMYHSIDTDLVTYLQTLKNPE